MVGMLQILTAMFAAYMVIKGLEIVQISVASSRPNRIWMVAWSVVLLIGITIAAVAFVVWQNSMAVKISTGMHNLP